MSNTSYPGAIDSPTDPTTSSTLASVPHHTQHGLANDALVALETKLGYGASAQTITGSGMYLVGTTAGQSQWVSTITSPSITTSLLDSNNNTWIGETPTASAVNYLNVTNNSAGNAPILSAKGSDTNISLNIVPKGSGKTQDNGSNLIDFRSSFANYVQSGCLWIITSGLVMNMTAGIVWIGGVEYNIALVSSHTFSANTDTYVDYTVGTGLVYTAVSNNSASPSLAANSIRLAILVAGASTITTTNQGQTYSILPTTTGSVPVAVCDTLGNLICPKANQRLLGVRVYPVGAGLTTTATSFTAMSAGLNIIVLPGNIPYNANVRSSIMSRGMTSSSSSGIVDVILAIGSATGTIIANASVSGTTANVPLYTSGLYPIFTSTTFVPAFQSNNASYTTTVQAFNVGIIHTVELD